MFVLVLLKTGVIRNSMSNPYKAKQTLDRLPVNYEARCKQNI